MVRKIARMWSLGATIVVMGMIMGCGEDKPTTPPAASTPDTKATPQSKGKAGKAGGERGSLETGAPAGGFKQGE